jgi:N-acetylglucosamine kinase
MLFAGIDAGQSSTVAVVIDDEGRVRGRGIAGPADHVDEPADSRRAATACERAVREALVAGGQPPDAPLEAALIGLSGYEGAWHGVEPELRARVQRYEHDAPVALAGALSERPAAVVIAGTGSVAYGETSGGRTIQVGGYGYLFGDEGSSFALARAALAAAMRTADRGVTTDLALAALAFFDVRSLRELVRAVSLRTISRPQVAAFARVVHDAARLGDEEARAMVDDAAAALAALGLLIVERLGGTEEDPVGVAFVGGGFANAEFRAAVEHRFAGSAPNGRVVTARYEPAVGAALLACEAAGFARPVTVLVPT